MVCFLPAQVQKIAGRIGFEFQAFPSLAVEITDRQPEFAAISIFDRVPSPLLPSIDSPDRKECPFRHRKLSTTCGRGAR